MVTKIAFTYAIAGTSKGDVMSLNDPDYAQTGDTYLLGALGGNDKIEIFNANVTVSGGSGDDSILLHAGGGSSYVSGDSGHDSITSYRNGVVLNGDIGNDTITSYAIEVKSVGGLGNDVFVVGGIITRCLVVQAMMW